MTPLTLRQAVLSDLEPLTSLFDAYRQFYGCASDVSAARAFLAARFNHGESVLFIAMAGDDPLGFTQLYPAFSSIALARIYVLNDLFVREEARRQGIAAKLLAAAVDYAAALGAARLSLSTAVDNATAQALYRAAGWQRDERFIHYDFGIARASRT